MNEVKGLQVGIEQSCLSLSLDPYVGSEAGESRSGSDGTGVVSASIILGGRGSMDLGSSVKA